MFMRAVEFAHPGRLRLVATVIWSLLPAYAAFGTDGKKEELEPPPLVVLSGSQSSLHLRPPLGLSVFSAFSRQNEVCTNFALRSRKGLVPEVSVTSTGLGDATFVDLATKPQVRQTMLPLTNLNTDGKSIQVCLPSQSVPSPGDSIEGKLLVLVGDRKPLEVPLKLDRPSSDPISSALQWFGALVVPALVAILIASVTAYLAERRKQKVRFEKFRDLAYAELRDFFGTHYATLHRDNMNAARLSAALENALREQRIWARIPDRERHRLIKCLRGSNAEATRGLLSKLFADWKDKIRGPK
jgi:hypothetical protein